MQIRFKKLDFQTLVVQTNKKQGKRFYFSPNRCTKKGRKAPLTLCLLKQKRAEV